MLQVVVGCWILVAMEVPVDQGILPNFREDYITQLRWIILSSYVLLDPYFPKHPDSPCRQKMSKGCIIIPSSSSARYLGSMIPFQGLGEPSQFSPQLWLATVVF